MPQRSGSLFDSIGLEGLPEAAVAQRQRGQYQQVERGRSEEAAKDDNCHWAFDFTAGRAAAHSSRAFRAVSAL